MTEKEKARELFLQGYNCAQAVFGAFHERFGIDEETALKISAGLGGGVGRQREVCGAVSSGSMVLGSICSATDGSDQESKKKNYELVREFSNRFKEKQGSIVCREILSLRVKAEPDATPSPRTEDYYKTRPCLRSVEDSAEILMDIIKKFDNEKEKNES